MIAVPPRPTQLQRPYKDDERRTAFELVPMGAAVHPRGVNPT
ncbi:hypothetical protein HDC35_001954 [Sphingopyxis sp. JAI128]|nr:hypothetical protein [Sphingopyxis sp. JAI128]